MVKHHFHGSIGHNKHGEMDASNDNPPPAAECDEGAAEPDAKRHRQESSFILGSVSNLLIQPSVTNLDLTGSKLNENDCRVLAAALSTPLCHLTALNMRWAAGTFAFRTDPRTD
jgi:hypothetical protein